MRRSESEEKENRRMLVRALTGGRRGAGEKRQRVSPRTRRAPFVRRRGRRGFAGRDGGQPAAGRPAELRSGRPRGTEASRAAPTELSGTPPSRRRGRELTPTAH